MRKPKRKKLIREKLEKILGKYERRIQRLAGEAYEIRTLLEKLTPPPAPVIEEKIDAPIEKQ